MAQQLPAEMQQKIREFQEVQQQARILMGQKYQLDIQMREAQNAVSELEKSNESDVYKAVGQILIKSSKSDVLKELKEKAETYETRIKIIEKQEKKSVERAKELQKSLQEGLSGIRNVVPPGEGA